MKAYKGFNPDLRSVMGNGQTATCNFQPGETKEVPHSKTVREGFHCCENPFDCLTYYSWDGKNRFFEVEAAGDIDEDDSNRIACTKITLLHELTDLEFALAGMQYIINHPKRKGWMQSRKSVIVKEDEAEVKAAGHIAIARGYHPMVKGVEGSILGFLVEGAGDICAAKIFRCNREQAGQWLELTPERKVIRV